MTKKNDTRGNIIEVKETVLNKIKELAGKGNIEDLQKFMDLVPKVQLLSNNLDEIDLKVNLLKRAI
ncbi:MAG TPA: hypothetical protein PKA39_09675, partial [Ignavibacteria bacterium]|nr:hypothetical protein [Ignavibacteria bacterium]